MPMSQVHFEIFRQQGKGGGGWSLVEAMEDRDAAIGRAKLMLEEGQAAGVRVVKETYQSSTGDYMSLTVFEAGQIEVKKKNKKVEDIENMSPCFKPDDLYSYHARMTMTRILGEWLGRQKLTVTELIHNAAALEKFEATGTTFQHAIQKVAVAQGGRIRILRIADRQAAERALHRRPSIASTRTSGASCSRNWRPDNSARWRRNWVHKAMRAMS